MLVEVHFVVGELQLIFFFMLWRHYGMMQKKLNLLLIVSSEATLLTRTVTLFFLNVAKL